jgi:DNA-binding NarL/FixJ family response regulator
MINQIKKVNRMIQIILLTERREDQWILKLVSQSISSVLLKNDCISSIIKTIETIEQGGLPIDPFISRIVFTMMQASDDNSKLTGQEKRILKLLGRGMTSQVIATELGISPATSRTHLKNIYKKLKVNSKTQALRKAKEERLIPLVLV